MHTSWWLGLILGVVGCGSEASLSNVPPPGALNPESVDASTRGTRFALAYLENLDLSRNGPPTFEVGLEASVPTQGRVRVPSTGLELPFDVPSGVSTVTLPDAQWYLLGSGVGNVGVEVVTDDPVQVVGYHQRRFFSEASRLLPIEELGGRYRILAVPDDVGESTSSFVVQAMEDETTVWVRPTAITQDLRPADVPYEVMLNRGQVLQVQANGDLTGTEVVADEVVAVFAGGRTPTVDCDSSSHAWDQLPPTSRWGTDYVVTPIPDVAFTNLMVLADQDDTTLTLDCEEVATLAAGESRRVRLDEVARLRSDKPVLAALVPPGGECTRVEGNDFSSFGDPNLVVLTPRPLTRDVLDVVQVDHPTFAEPAPPLTEDPNEVLRPDRADHVIVVEGDDTVTTIDLSQRVRVEGRPVQGIAFGVALYNAYTYGLGFDCVDCAGNLATPSICE